MLQVLPRRFGFTQKTYQDSRNVLRKSYDTIHEPYPTSRYLVEQQEHVHFLKAQSTRMFSENYIRWASKYGKTIVVCIHPDGCTSGDLYEISQDSNPEDFEYLDQLIGFDEKSDDF